MPFETATAIVLRAVEFSESSLVVTLFTRELGKIGAIAKGAKRPKNPFESALDLLAVCRIVFIHKSSDALDILTEARLLRRFRPAGRELSSLYAGYYVAEVLRELTDEDDPHPRLFDLVDETLIGLAEGEPVPRRVIRFELGALRTLGHLPSLDTCVECGCPPGRSGRLAFGVLDGGVLCPDHRRGRRHVVSLSAGTVQTMAQLADPESRTWSRLEISPQNLEEIRGVMNQYVSHLMGRQPRMHAYLGPP